MGHALDNTLQDILIRYKRMSGYSTLWLPGTDHASIATEAKIVEAMKKEEEEMLAKYAGGAAASADPKAAKGQGYHVQDLVDAIREDRPVYLGPKDAVTALKIVLAVYKSAKEGREVFISEFDD